jgi:hypothetical protein
VKENVRRTRGVELERTLQVIKPYLRCVAQIDVQEIMDERPHKETSQMKTVFSLRMSTRYARSPKAKER